MINFMMVDMNESIGSKEDLYNFMLENDLIDSVSLLNPDMEENPTYLWGNNRINYIFISPALAEVALKAGHHQFHQHFTTDHKGVYLRFRADDLFATELMDKTHTSYRRLRLGRRDIMERYVGILEHLYKEHKILERTQAIGQELV